MTFCGQCGHQGMEGASFCGECGTRIENVTMIKYCHKCKLEVEGEGYDYKGSYYHEKCFRCNQCSQGLNGIKFVIYESLPLCISCRDKKGGSAPNQKECYRCKQSLSGQVVEGLQQLYHQRCFTCYQCKGAFNGSFMNKNGEPHCIKCVPRTTSTPTGDKINGIRVNNRQGNIQYYH